MSSTDRTFLINTNLSMFKKKESGQAAKKSKFHKMFISPIFFEALSIATLDMSTKSGETTTTKVNSLNYIRIKDFAQWRRETIKQKK